MNCIEYSVYLLCTIDEDLQCTEEVEVMSSDYHRDSEVITARSVQGNCLSICAYIDVLHDLEAPWIPWQPIFIRSVQSKYRAEPSVVRLSQRSALQLCEASEDLPEEQGLFDSNPLFLEDISFGGISREIGKYPFLIIMNTL
jgi:hypothetical protein